MRTGRLGLLLLCALCCLAMCSCATAPPRVERDCPDLAKIARDKYGYGQGVVVKAVQEAVGGPTSLTLRCPPGADKNVSSENRVSMLGDLAKEAARLNAEAGTPLAAKGTPPWLENFKYEVGDIVLTSTNDPIGFFVRLFTFCKYNHVAIITNVVDKEPFVGEAIPPGGVRVVGPRGLIRNPEIAVMIRRKSDRWFTENMRGAVAKHILDKRQKPYDFWFLFRVAISRIPLIGRLFLTDKETERYVCTELVQVAYYQGVKDTDATKLEGILFSPYPIKVGKSLPDTSWWPLHFIVAKDFMRTPKLETVLRKEKGPFPESRLARLKRAREATH